MKRGVTVRMHEPVWGGQDPFVDVVVAMQRRDASGLWIPNLAPPVVRGASVIVLLAQDDPPHPTTVECRVMLWALADGSFSGQSTTSADSGRDDTRHGS